MSPETRLKVMTIVGTRPEFIKLSRVIAALDQTTDHVLVHSGRSYDHELNAAFFEQPASAGPISSSASRGGGRSRRSPR